MSERVTNWAGNIVFSAAELARPRTIADLQRLVADSDQVRVLGTGHSFNRVADTSGTLVSVRDLPRVLELDREAATVRVGKFTSPVGLERLQSSSSLSESVSISSVVRCAVGPMPTLTTWSWGASPLRVAQTSLYVAIEVVPFGQAVCRYGR